MQQSTPSPKKVNKEHSGTKALDPSRPNLLPKVHAGRTPEKSPLRTTTGLEFDDVVQRQKLLQLLSQPDKTGGTRERTDIVKLMEQKRLEEAAHRKVRERDMFNLESESMDAFILPGRPVPIGLLSPENKKSKGRASTKLQVQLEVSTDEGDGKPSKETKEEHEFAFLPDALGTVRSPTKKPEQTLMIDPADDGSGENPAAADADATQPPPPPKPTDGGRGKGTTSDLDEIDGILEGIKTGSDAVHFFARYGSETPVKFVHLKLAVPDDSRAFRPYDLERVDLNDIPSDHFIMSPAGVVHVCPGEPSECLPLSSWVRQGMIFNILRNIRFYKFFLHRKMFQTWRANVRFQLFAKQRKRVSEKLFLTRKTSSKPILAIKRCLMDVQNMNLLQLDLRTTDKATFVDQQSAQCHRASQLFEESMQQVDKHTPSDILVYTPFDIPLCTLSHTL